MSSASDRLVQRDIPKGLPRACHLAPSRRTPTPVELAEAAGRLPAADISCPRRARPDRWVSDRTRVRMEDGRGRLARDRCRHDGTLGEMEQMEGYFPNPSVPRMCCVETVAETVDKVVVVSSVPAAPSKAWEKLPFQWCCSWREEDKDTLIPIQARTSEWGAIIAISSAPRCPEVRKKSGSGRALAIHPPPSPADQGTGLARHAVHPCPLPCYPSDSAFGGESLPPSESFEFISRVPAELLPRPPCFHVCPCLRRHPSFPSRVWLLPQCYQTEGGGRRTDGCWIGLQSPVFARMASTADVDVGPPKPALLRLSTAGTGSVKDTNVPPLSNGKGGPLHGLDGTSTPEWLARQRSGGWRLPGALPR